MSHGKTGEDGEGRRRKKALEDLLAADAIAWVALVEVTEDNASDASEHVVETKRREEPVDAVGALADIFQKEDGAVEGRHIGSPDEGSDDPEVSSVERARRCAISPDVETVQRDGCFKKVRLDGVKPLASDAYVASKGADHGSV